MKVVYSARCFSCEWTADGDNADREAEKHGKATGHSTVSSGRPA